MGHEEKREARASAVHSRREGYATLGLGSETPRREGVEQKRLGRERAAGKVQGVAHAVSRAGASVGRGEALVLLPNGVGGAQKKKKKKKNGKK